LHLGEPKPAKSAFHRPRALADVSASMRAKHHCPQFAGVDNFRAVPLGRYFNGSGIKYGLGRRGCCLRWHGVDEHRRQDLRWWWWRSNRDGCPIRRGRFRWSLRRSVRWWPVFVGHNRHWRAAHWPFGWPNFGVGFRPEAVKHHAKAKIFFFVVRLFHPPKNFLNLLFDFFSGVCIRGCEKLRPACGRVSHACRCRSSRHFARVRSGKLWG